MKVLAGIRVIEVAQWGFVPSAAGALAEWGAEVVKIEDPAHGDPMRGLAVADIGPGTGGFTPMWEIVGRGKLSVGLDIRTPAGLEILMRLVETADVFMTSFMPDARRRLGIDVDDVRARNSKIIYARGSGQGPRGPDADKGGFDAISFWSRSGLASASIPPEATSPPRMPAPAFGDTVSGVFLAGGIAAAIAGRERTGEGAVVDVSLLNSGLWAAQANIVGSLLTGNDNIAWQVPHDRPGNVFANSYRTKDDRFVALNVLQGDRYWPGLCEALGRPDLLEDPRFVDAEARASHRTECVRVLDEVFASRTLAEWQDRLSRQEGQWDVVRTPAEAGADPQAWENEYLRRVDYGDGREITLVSVPVQFDETGNPTSPAPGQGADTDDVVLGLGVDWDELIRLKLDGVVS